jgi:PAS domain S-box-containing protein
MFKPPWGVRAILILLVLVAVAPIFALVIHTSGLEQRHAIAQAKQELRSQVQLRARAQEQLIHGVRQMLTALAYGAPGAADSGPDCDARLRRVHQHFPTYAHLAFADLQGNIACRSASDQRPTYIGDRAYYTGAARSGRFSIGEYMQSRILARPSIAMSLPVVDDQGRPRGQQYAVLDAVMFQQQLVSSPAPAHVTELVTDGRGRVLASLGPAALATGDQLPGPLLAAISHDSASEGAAYEDAQSEWIQAVRWVRAEGEGGLAVLARQPAASVLAPSLWRLRLQLVVLLAVAAAASLLAWRLGDRLLARPVERLVRFVGALERNEAPPAAPVGDGPVRELARIERGVADLATALAARSAQRDAAMAQIEQQKLSLERSEQRYRTHFEASPQPMWVFDLETLAFLEVNDAAVRQYGYTREEFLAMTIADIRPPEEIPKLMASLERSAAGGMATRHIRKDGRVVHVEVSGQSQQWNGRPGRAVAVVDVTSRVEAAAAWQRLHETLERQVAERTKELVAANEELEAFSYSVSHDLRGPLQIIDGFCAVLVERHGAALPTQAVHYLERIRAGTGQMDTLIRDLLAFGRTGREPLVHQSVDLAPLARQVVASLRERWPQREVAVEIEEPLPAVGDPAMLMVVLENLLGNAWKFTARVPEASISLRCDGAGSYVVTDNGAGFDPAYAGKLFRPFQRLHSTAEFEGSGVGLTIVQRIVQRHGGKVWGESERGRGARFFFTLPAPLSTAQAEAVMTGTS